MFLMLNLGVQSFEVQLLHQPNSRVHLRVLNLFLSDQKVKVLVHLL